MKLSALIEDRLGIERLKGSDPKSVFDEVAQVLIQAGAAAPSELSSLRQAFLDRERQGTTAFDYGMAIPHIFHASLSRIYVVIARHPTGFGLGATDGQLTKTLICVAGPESQRDSYLKLLSHIARTLRDRNWRRFIQQAVDTSAVFDILLEACPE
jgi:PTS system fructose-specific IIA component